MIYNVSYFNLGGLGSSFGGAEPTKAPPRGDGTALIPALAPWSVFPMTFCCWIPRHWNL